MNRADVLRINPRWTDADRALIASHLDRLGATTFDNHTSTRAYVNGFDGDGKRVIEVGMGQIVFPPGRQPSGAIRHDTDWHPLGHYFVPLSTHRAHSGGPHVKEPEPEVCLVCFTTRAVSGACLCQGGSD